PGRAQPVTTGRGFFPYSVGAPPHDWLNNMGGSIGFGAPVAVGAAVACPDRKVICMIGDGSAMYTIQALWTMARENLDVCVLIFSNRNYKILYSQLADVGAANPPPPTPPTRPCTASPPMSARPIPARAPSTC